MTELKRLVAVCASAILIVHSTLAATYHVEKTGNDSNSGSQGSPWFTVQKAADTAVAGDTVRVGPGVYPEVVKTKNAGTAGNRIVYDGQGVATLHWVQIRHPYSTLQNFNVSGYTNTWFHGSIDIMEGAHWTVVSNCFIQPVIERLGGIGFDQGSVLPFDDNSPNNCVIVDNTITDVIGRWGFSVMGSNNLFEGNTLTNLYKSDFILLWGRNNIIRGNTFANMLDYPIGNHPDFVQTFGQNGQGSKGHLIENNLVSNMVNGQLAQLTRSDGFTDPLANTPNEMADWTFRNNIFRDIAFQSSCSIPGMKYYNNVFYRCNFMGGHALAFGHGVRGSAEGFRIFNNVFLDCGSPGQNNVGWYATNRPDGTPWNDGQFNFNYVAKDGFAPVREENPPSSFRWYEPNGINGGNPMFAGVGSANFRLLVGSPLIDRGTIVSVNQDIDGLSRPRGTTWDIGPYEFDAGVVASRPLPPVNLEIVNN
jgi:hypothetical protein